MSEKEDGATEVIPDGEEAWLRAAEVIRGGGLLAFRTDTFYGIGADPFNPEAVRRIDELKGREGKPILVLVSDRAWAERLTRSRGRLFDALSERFWPGPLTLVLLGGERRVPARLRGPEGGVAVRWTSHVGLGRLIRALGDPITSTSANRPRQPPAVSAAEIVRQWGDALGRGVLRLLDGGTLSPSAPSTVVDCTGRRPRVIRPGAIPSATLRESVPHLIGDV